MKSIKAFQTIKIWEKTRRALKVLAAQQARPMTEVLDELVVKAVKENAVQKS